MKLLLFLFFTALRLLLVAQVNNNRVNKVARIDTPVLFLPAAIMKKYAVRDMAISPDGQEMFFTIQSPESLIMCILHCTKSKNKWTEPSIATFSGQYSDLEPAFSPDGNKIFFASNRPFDKQGRVKDFDIWFIEKTGSRWSEPVNAGPNINTTSNEFFPAVTSSGNIYFTAAYPDSKGKEDIYCSEWKNGSYQKPQSLSSAVNSPFYEFNAYVSPNENLIIFSSQGRDDELGGGDLYFSQKSAAGVWQKAVHLPAPINSDRLDYCPFISFDNSYFYFTSTRSLIKEQFEKPLQLADFVLLLEQPANGKGNIYKIDLRQLMKY